MIRFLRFILLVGMCVHALPCAAEPAGAILAPEAQEAFKRGMAAVGQQDWELAVRRFTEANKAAPAAPAILFNLGLAHSKAGHELAAIAWLDAYLIADPQSPNAVAVRQEITRLKRATEERITKIFQGAIALVDELQAGQQDVFDQISYSQAAAGRIDEALETVTRGYEYMIYQQEKAKGTRRSGEMDPPTRRWQIYAASLREAGHLARLSGLPERLRSAEEQDVVWNAIAGYFRDQWDSASASKAAQHVQQLVRSYEWPSDAKWALKGYAEGAMQQGDIKLAEEAMAFLPVEDREMALWQKVSVQLERGDIAGAEATTRRLTKDDDKVHWLAEIALAQLAQGDAAGAAASAEAVGRLDAGAREIWKGDAAVAEAILGRLDAAIALAQRDEGFKRWALRRIAFVQWLRGDKAGVRKLERLVRANSSESSAEFQAMLYLLKGDAAQALEAIKGVRAPSGDFFTYLAKLQMRDGDLAGAEETYRKAVALVPPWKADALLDLARFYRQAGRAQEAIPVLNEARQLGLSELAKAKSDSDKWSPTSLLGGIAALQRDIGDHAGAEETRALALRLPVIERVSPALSAWVILARSVSQDQMAVDIEQALREAGEPPTSGRWAGRPTGIPVQVADVGARLGKLLLRIEALEGS